jgi:hypothetical protein
MRRSPAGMAGVLETLSVLRIMLFAKLTKNASTPLRMEGDEMKRNDQFDNLARGTMHPPIALSRAQTGSEATGPRPRSGRLVTQ